MMPGFLRCLVLLLAVTVSLPAKAYPDRPISLVVGWAAGGSTDVIARLIAVRLSDKLGQQVIVVNKPGASGTIGAQFVANEKPDGYTLYYGTNSTYALAPWLYGSLPYDFDKAFEEVSFVGSMPMILGVRLQLPAKTLPELIDQARAKPRGLTFGSSSAGSTSHIAAELLMWQAGIELTHVPYRGGGPALAALLSGEIDILFNDIATLEPMMKSQRVRGLASTTSRRLAEMPDLPTVAEAGLQGFEVATTNAVFVPRGTPAAVISRLHEALKAVLAEPALAKELALRGMIVQPSTPQDLASHVRQEQAKWRSLLQARGITLNP